jgi:hypothetical protein
MRLRLAIAASLASLAVAGAATARSAGLQASASDTAPGATVHGDTRISERWHCTPAGCAGAPSSALGPALGFAAAALATAGIARRRAPGRP